jgi:hypothetical protein
MRFLNSLMLTAYPAHLILFDYPRIFFFVNYKMYFLQHPVISCLLGSNILLRAVLKHPQSMLIVVVWLLTPCKLVGGYQRFGETYLFHLQG